MTEPDPSSRPGDWRIPFFTIWSGQAFSLFGSFIVQFALVWYLTIETGSAVVLSTSVLMSVLPRVFLAPFAGALVDRLNRRWVMILSDLAIALTTMGLVLLFWSGKIAIWHIFAASFIRGLGGTFQFPAMAASTSLMVPQRHLSRINGVNQALDGGLAIISPPLGALLVTLWPMQQVLFIDIITAGLAVGSLLLISIPQPKKVDGEALTPARLLSDVVDGLRYVRGYKGLMHLMGIAVVVNMILSPASSLAPLLVTKVFGGGAYQISMLDSAMGIGLVAGGLLLGVWGGFRKQMLTSLSGLIGMAIGLLLIGLAPRGFFWLVPTGALLTGLMSPICNGPINAMLQANVQPEAQGRILSLLGAFSGAASPVGLLLAAPLSDHFGVQVFFLVGALVTLALGITAFFSPPLMNLEDTMRRDRGAQTGASAS